MERESTVHEELLAAARAISDEALILVRLAASQERIGRMGDLLVALNKAIDKAEKEKYRKPLLWGRLDRNA